ncbi:Uncharacterised protein [Vibrio cholerae]|uniref:Uncharacterized protein n=1 Tax=Vibrio cholerae TaxID=666 RepID=A0A655X5Q6_VIBCL|nr:Uncharacterised protein [Vibrio cholerae]
MAKPITGIANKPVSITNRRPTASEVTAQGTRQSDKAKVEAANNQLIWVSETEK